MTTNRSPRRVAWITGGGSGTGRAVAVRAAASGRAVAISGRRTEALEETSAQIVAAGGEAPLIVPLDVRDPEALAAAHSRVAAELGAVDDLVLAAGVNTPQRTWADQSITEFAAIVETNLTAAARAVDLVLPGMRESGGGTIVVVSSISAWRLSPGAGVAYTASKRGLKALTETLNGQEGRAGIRATLLLPGDIDSEFLRLRPEEPGEAERARMLTPDDVASTVQCVLDLPAHITVDELVVSPTGF
ncbi:SDR family NAD(P)-dependent oxidoreductase [Microbacterium pseudoresistens]|uniref:NADP-dependent 3-hydroxy acid dehydrogenase YdfG n=1 Tax=Microbacterium pseudoresistens TaxID=640634 RepID=A0A7Y9JLB0_9MICO|nr:SDR family NAD(P)-dependent oxidoreductase [Microbacterium pseudoresistens]NYD53140.1 NADP-dependent 3-hydroxy acid dehydrogenase YdfG [Microbacterium pseudoresistens]